MNTNEFTGYLQHVSEVATTIFNLAPAPFTVVITLVLCYIPRIWPKFPNDKIPWVCIIVGTLIFSGLNDRNPSMELIKYWIRTISAGFVFSLATWLLHNQIISKFEDKLPIIGKLLNWSDQKRTAIDKD
jgi:MFS superfamily sulfate permease-like transporter